MYTACGEFEIIERLDDSGRWGETAAMKTGKCSVTYVESGCDVYCYGSAGHGGAGIGRFRA